MDKLDQVRGLLRAIKNIALQGIYAEVYRGMEAQCAATYRKCIATLKTVQGFEDIESLAPELSENPSMKEISFAAETVLSLISAGQGPMWPAGPGHFRMPGMRMHVRGRGPGSMVVRLHKRRLGRHGHADDLEEEMREKIEEEQERFEENVEKIEDQIEELQDKIEELRDKLEERLESIREAYEERMEELESEEDEDEDEDEEDDEPKA